MDARRRDQLMCLNCPSFRFHRLTRLRLPGGGYVFLEWHDYLGPTFFRDRAGNREIVLCATDMTYYDAFNWWHSRGKRG